MRAEGYGQTIMTWSVWAKINHYQGSHLFKAMTGFADKSKALKALKEIVADGLLSKIVTVDEEVCVPLARIDEFRLRNDDIFVC